MRKFGYSTVWVYVSVVVMTLTVTVTGKALQPIFDLINISLLYLLPVLISAVRWGLWPSISASLLGILLFDYFFIPPVLSFTVADIGYLLNFTIFLVVAVVTGTLASRLRTQADAARERERRTGALYSLSHKIVVETDIRRVFQAVVDKIGDSVKVKAAILMPDAPCHELATVVHSGSEEFLLDQKQMATAQWVFEHRRRGGQGTDILRDVNDLFIPIADGTTSLAVLAVEFCPQCILSREQQKDIEAFANLTALAITRLRLANEAEQAKWLLESEKLHTALLNAVSHDLRTPLSYITGAVTELLAEEDRYDRKTRKALLQAINEGARRMNRFVTNLLDMTRIESGILKPNREWCDMLDIIGVAVKEVRDMLPETRIDIKAPAELPLVEVDFALIEQVLINLLENAVKYSPAGSTISLDVTTRENQIVISVMDHGPSIPDDERERIFDKFYRLRSSRHVTGTGLGLSISRALIEAHEGKVSVERGPGEGNAFVFTLPLRNSQPPSMPAKEEENGGR